MREPLDILILCGGRGERLGGLDKPLVPLAGRPLVEHVLARLPPARRVWISANRNAAAYARYAEAVIDDGRHAGRGPLAGVLAGLQQARGDALLVVPGDAPALPRQLDATLAAARRAGGHPAAYACDRHGPQPLCALLGTGLRAALEAYLDAGGDTPRLWYAAIGAAPVRFDDGPDWAWSLNTAAEWAAAEAALAAATLPPP